MSPRRINTDQIKTLQGQNIFLDANILIFQFCPFLTRGLRKDTRREKILGKYSKAFKDLVGSNNTLYTDVTVLSEFINTSERLAFGIYQDHQDKKHQRKGANFDFKKDYKKTVDYKENISLILTISKKILTRLHVANCNYRHEDLRELIGHMENRRIDFNDLHIEKLCRQNGFILLTDDKDYKGAPIDILSANPKLL